MYTVEVVSRDGSEILERRFAADRETAEKIAMEYGGHAEIHLTDKALADMVDPAAVEGR